MISPNSPISLPNVSTIKILTNRTELAASDRAAPDPTYKKIKFYKLEIATSSTCPTQSPQTRLVTPVVTPAPNMAYPEK